MKTSLLILAAIFFALAIIDHNYREFATAGGLCVLASAIYDHGRRKVVP